MKHALDLQGLVRDAVRLELFRQQPYRIAEDLVAPIDEEGRRPATQIVQQYVDTLVVRIDAMQIRVHRNVPRQYVERSVVGDRVLAKRQAHFGREQQHGSRSSLGVHADAMEHGAHQTTTTRIAGEDQPFGVRDPPRPSGSSRRGRHPQPPETGTPAPAGSQQQRWRIRSLAPGVPGTTRTCAVTYRYSPHRGDTRSSPVTERSRPSPATVGTRAPARHRDCPGRP